MITITVDSPDRHVGKTTVGGVIQRVLEELGYEVEAVPVAHALYPKEQRHIYVREEHRRMREAADYLVRDKRPSTPGAKVRLLVHG